MRKHRKKWFALVLGLIVWMQVPVIMGAQESMSTEIPDMAKSSLDMTTAPAKPGDDCLDGCPPKFRPFKHFI